MPQKMLEFNKAICLIEAVDDLRFPVIRHLVEEKNFDPNSKNQRGYSVVHYLCGIDNIVFAERTLVYLFQHGAKVNEVTLFERFSPLHIAALNDRVSIAKILIKQGADKKILDADNNPPIFYAINNECWPMVEVIRNYILHEKRQIRKQNSRDLLQSAQLNSIQSITNGSNGTLNVFEQNLTVAGANSAYLEADRSITPSRISYNFDKASPYYVNITHRRRNNTSSNARQSLFQSETQKNVNIFELTEDNLAQFTQTIRESGRFEMFQRWKDAVNEHKKRESVLSTILNEIDEIIGDDNQHLEVLMTEDETFVTAEASEDSEKTYKPENLQVPVRESDFIKSPTRTKGAEIVMQMTERYVHTDDEKNIIFYEKKLLPVDPVSDQIDEESDKKSTTSAASTAFKLNTDYDTDQLRQELTQFGDIPGPITKSTKKLYLKRLVKYRHDPKMAEEAAIAKANNIPVYSLELQKTFSNIHTGLEAFTEYLMLEEEMVRHFQQKICKKMREGNKKMSFIYLLMDPRELNNLAANHLFISKEQAWRQFIKAIFYVGKGKKSRPYAHLYEAIRYYGHITDVEGDKENCFNRHPQPKNSGFRSKTRPALIGNQFLEPMETESKKLKRILDIWSNGHGVVSMHLFHNITPSEAYTREAAIIDALGMNNLTNQVRGHYYGISESWTFKQRKQLGVGLLYKALQIHLIEGESQLLPHDI
ncbi:ankyrin repeat and LEM domain-containing protein 1 homolog [Culicoides brevitarsis]|uniref:ankyrin repeat and LEM domain-containing protein 1 homolog n=1 Tax=Culicoides brevitarsis TaxID=469753 RepID=UPI00307B936D